MQHSTQTSPPLPNRKSATIDGLRISYLDNEMQGNAILFIHGNSLSSDNFLPQLSATELKSFRLIAIDLPGHGNSEKATVPEKTYTPDGYAKTIVALVDQLSLNNFILCGNSMGGHIAIRSLKNLPHAKGIFLFSTPPLRSAVDFAEAFIPTPVAQSFFQGEIDHEKCAELAKALVNDQDPQLIQTFEKEIFQTDPIARSTIAAYLANGKLIDEVQALDDANIPVALVQGQHEPFENLSYIKSLNLNHLWRNTVHVIPNAGHLPNIDYPTAFNSLLTEFSKNVL